MASNPTKILAYDLDPELGKIFEELNRIKGDFQTLDERFNNIDVNMLGESEKAVLEDLISALNNDFKGTASERLRRIESSLIALQEALGAIDPNQLEEGNFEESFVYQNGDVIKHVSIGDQAFVTDYVYKADGSGELETSTKTFARKTGETVSIHKVYTYENGDITKITTTTTVTPVAE